MAALDHQCKAGLLCRLNLLGLPHHLYCQQRQRLFESLELGDLPQCGKLRFCPTLYIQLATFCILLLGCYIASLGLNPLKKLLTAAGTCTFVVSLLYIVMMFAVPVINSKAE